MAHGSGVLWNGTHSRGEGGDKGHESSAAVRRDRPCVARRRPPAHCQGLKAARTRGRCLRGDEGRAASKGRRERGKAVRGEESAEWVRGGRRGGGTARRREMGARHRQVHAHATSPNTKPFMRGRVPGGLSDS